MSVTMSGGIGGEFSPICPICKRYHPASAVEVVKAHGLEFRVVRCGPSRLVGELSRAAAAEGKRRDHPQEAPMKGSKKGGKGGKMPPGKGGKC